MLCQKSVSFCRAAQFVRADFFCILRKLEMRVAKYVERMGRGREKPPLWTPKRNVKLPLDYVKYERLC